MVSDLNSAASLGVTLGYASSTLTMYSSWGQYLGTTAKLGPMVKGVSCTLVKWWRRLTTLLALMLFTVAVVSVVFVLAEVEVMVMVLL